MEVCSNCFSDKELKAFISSTGANGNCKVCKSKNISLLSINELLDFFQELLDNFQKLKQGDTLKSKIQGGWSFFSTHVVATRILNHILPLVNTEILNADNNVEYSDDIIENIAYWETLKKDIKRSNRFLINIQHLTEELGWDSFFNTQFELTSKDNLYRARVHHQSGLPAYLPNKMGCPPADKASGGRANPSGIPYLYLSDNEATVLYEVRASYLDELSVATFNLKAHRKPIKIVDFTEDTSLYKPTNVNETIKSRFLRDKISQDLSKAMRRYDTEIEYIPTQFICEFIRIFTGAKGIRFTSSLHPSGKNIVIFDQKLMKCKSVKRKRINNINLTAIELS